jgi:hypothetical protein
MALQTELITTITTPSHNTKEAASPERMIGALETIRDMAMAHIYFDADHFARRDVDGLCAQGGDICDWTMVAIHADDALNPKDPSSTTAATKQPDCNRDAMPPFAAAHGWAERSNSKKP